MSRVTVTEDHVIGISASRQTFLTSEQIHSLGNSDILYASIKDIILESSII